MKEKKASADWYIAATHWLTAGFVVPFLLNLVVGILLVLLLGGDDLLLLSISFGILYVISIWLGVMYSAKYLDKTYIIKDAHNIALISTIYLAIIGGGFRLSRLLENENFLYEFLGFVIGVVVFYVASKKYVKNNTAQVQSAVNNAPASGSSV